MTTTTTSEQVTETNSPGVAQATTDVENQDISDDDGAAAKPTNPPMSLWSKNKAMAVSVAFVVVALAVGLSVGLTMRKNNHGSAASAATANQANNNNSTTSTTTTTKPSVPTSFAASTLPTFGQQALVPYPSCDAFTSDLTTAVERLVNTSIEANVQWFYHSNFTNGGCIDCHRPLLYSASAPVSSATSSTTSSSAKGVSSYGTNNQVAGVDEADFVKSNGVYVFSVYGSEVVVLDPTNTTLLSRTTIPMPNISTFYPDVNFSALNKITPTSGNSSPGVVGVASNTTSSSNVSAASSSPVGVGISIGGPSLPVQPASDWNCYTSISSLLLTGDRLVVIASPSCYFYSYNYTPSEPILSGSDATAVFVYDVSNVPTDGTTPLTLLSQTTLNGYYGDARSIDSIAYLVSSSYIDTYTNLLSYVDIYNLAYNGNQTLTEAQYLAQARAAAKKIIPVFVNQLVGELQNATGTTSCDNLIRLTLLQTSQVNGTAADATLGFTGNGVLSTLTLVTSFDVSKSTAGGDLTKSTAGLFQPTSGSNIYANAKRLIVAGQGWNQRDDGGWWEETYLLVFRLNGATIQADALGQVPGYTINQFSLDAAQQNGVDYLRVATTTSSQWGLVDGYWNQTSASTNQLFVLEFPADGASSRVLSVAGSISNISVSQSIQSVRFFGDEAFISTFQYTDPFYTVDLSVPSAPKLVGELHVPGFSSYLQPIANGTHILAVGQNANETTGMTTGLEISLFDVSDFAKPTRLQSYTVPTNNNNGWSYSEAQYDHQAFRYLEEPKLLIIPVSVNDFYFNNSFDGFVVYNVDPTAGITPSFTIEHANNYDIRFGCWSSAYLQSRSLVFSGNVLTLKGHTVENHNLDSHKLLGSVLDLDKNLNRSDCGGYFM